MMRGLGVGAVLFLFVFAGRVWEHFDNERFEAALHQPPCEGRLPSTAINGAMTLGRASVGRPTVHISCYTFYEVPSTKTAKRWLRHRGIRPGWS